MTKEPPLIVGIGEALFDVFPHAEILGGAPLNTAVSAHQLLAPSGGSGVVVSCVGEDEHGEQIKQELTSRGMTADYVQTDAALETGTVKINIHDDGHSFTIAEPSAWDHITFTPQVAEVAARCTAVCFGTLAQRNPQSREAIQKFLAAAPAAIRLFDVNLRQNYFDRELIEQSCTAATVIKLNDEELPVIAQLLELSPTSSVETDEQVNTLAASLRQRFDVQAVILTRGERGTVMFTADDRFEAEPVSYSQSTQADGVGAGDACTAGIVVGMIRQWPPKQQLALANHAGAYVATVPGPTPPLPDEIIALAAS